MQLEAKNQTTTQATAPTEKTLLQRTKSKITKAVAVAGVAAATFLPVGPAGIKALHADPKDPPKKTKPTGGEIVKNETASERLDKLLKARKQERDFLYSNFGKQASMIGRVVNKNVRSMKKTSGTNYTTTPQFRNLSSQAAQLVNQLSTKAERKAFPGDKDRAIVDGLKKDLSKKGVDPKLFISLKDAQKKAKALDAAASKATPATTVPSNSKESLALKKP